MSKTAKRILIIAICVVAFAVIVGGVYLISQKNKKAVTVYSIDTVGMLDYFDWSGGTMVSGEVKADRIQQVYVSSTQIVNEICVNVGDEVKVGDPLMAYDSTLSELNVEAKDIAVKKLEQSIKTAKKEFEVIKTYKPGVPMPNSFAESGEIKLASWDAYLDNMLPNNEDAADTPILRPTLEIPLILISGEGTVESPYIYLWDESASIGREFLISVLGETDDAFFILTKREGNFIDGLHEYSYAYEVKKVEEEITFTPAGFMPAEEDPLIKFGPEQPTDPTEPTDPTDPTDPWEDPGITYTADEIARMLMEKEIEIKDLETQYKVAQVELERLKLELDNQTVKSTIDGVVTMVNDVEMSAIDGTPVITVSGGGGYVIEGGVNELNYDNIHVGDQVTISDWMSGSELSGTISEISQFPATSNMYGGDNDASIYPFYVTVEDGANLYEGSWVDINLAPAQQEGEGGLYLMKAFVRSEGGASYVLARDENGKLKKVTVATGKSLWGEYVQILSGVTAEDFLAFPYGDAKEGATTIEGTIDDLYGAVYY